MTKEQFHHVNSEAPAPAAPAAGFTIIELIITLAVLAVVTAIAMPRFGSAIGRYRADLAVRRVVADLNFARARAVSRSTSQTVSFDASLHRYWLVDMADPDRQSRAYGVELARPPYEANFVKLDLGDDFAIVFDGYGVPDRAGTIVLGVGGIRKVIAIEAGSGAVTVQ
jgi:prepilin-type N-terminal cleavage/methylation domain-containing protein